MTDQTIDERVAEFKTSHLLFTGSTPRDAYDEARDLALPLITALQTERNLARKCLEKYGELRGGLFKKDELCRQIDAAIAERDEAEARVEELEGLALDYINSSHVYSDRGVTAQGALLKAIKLDGGKLARGEVERTSGSEDRE